MEKRQLTTDESLQIIRDMVSKTKHNIAADKIVYLMWGYTVAFCSLLHYSLLVVIGVDPNIAPLVWLSMPLLGIIHGFYFRKRNKNRHVKTHIDRALSSVWLSFIAALLVFLFSAPVVGWQVVYPMLMVLYGIGASTSGGILNFKPLIIGGALSMAIGFISFHMDFEIQLLLLATAIIISFVLPAHQLPKENKV